MVILYNFVSSGTTGQPIIISPDEYVNIILEFVNMVLGLGAIIAVISSFQQFQETNFGKVLIYFSFGTFLLTLIRLFLTLSEVKIIYISDETATMGNIYYFYLA